MYVLFCSMYVGDTALVVDAYNATTEDNASLMRDLLSSWFDCVTVHRIPD